MIKKYFAIIKLILINPKLFLLAYRLRSTKKTFLGYGRLLSLAESFFVLKKKKPDAINIAEFGVGRGGSAMILASLMNSYGGNLFLFDIFGRIPAPSTSDGEMAYKRYDFIVTDEKEDYYGNLPNLLNVIQQDLSTITSVENIKFIVGKYEETLPEYSSSEIYDLVHIDCDWYESTKTVLHFLKYHLNQYAIIQIDDFMHWQGTQKAVKEASWLSNYHHHLVEGALIIDLGKPVDPS